MNVNVRYSREWVCTVKRTDADDWPDVEMGDVKKYPVCPESIWFTYESVNGAAAELASVQMTGRRRLKSGDFSYPQQCDLTYRNRPAWVDDLIAGIRENDRSRFPEARLFQGLVTAGG